MAWESWLYGCNRLSHKSYVDSEGLPFTGIEESSTRQLDDTYV